MNSTDLAFLPALEQAQLIRRREVSPLELTQLYLDRIEKFDSQFGSYFTVLAEQAIADATAKTAQVAQVDNPNTLPPFFGVPISVKDLNPMQGVPYTLGCAALKQSIGQFDDAIVAKIKQAGFVILGKTATPELGTMPFTEPPGFPPARNPWNPDYTPGGSSGGAAAALAAGFCAIAQGSDGGGSIRGPAFCCGLLGLKPSRGRISYAPIGDTPGGIGTNGPLARTVADAAAFLDVTAGYVMGDPYWLPDPNPSFLQTARQGAEQGTGKPLKVAYLTDLKPFGAIHPTCHQSVMTTVQRLTNLGHHLEEMTLDCSALVDPFTIVFRACLSGTGVPTEAMSPMNQWLISHNDTAGAYFAAVWEMQMISRQLVAQFYPYDMVIMPVYTQPQIRVGEWANLTPEQAFEQVVRWIAPCPLFNATGQPAIALPTGFADTGLPTGVQLVGRPGDESTLIAAAAQLEAHHPWLHHASAIESRW